MNASLRKDPLTPNKRARLLQFLGSLPAGAATRLFAALEADRARGGASLPFDFLLDGLRSQINAMEGRFPARPATAQRLFFAPFEDFFIAFRSGKKRRARIARASIGPIWSLLTADPACASAARAIAALDAALRERAPNPGAHEEAMFNAAGQGLARLIAHAQAEPQFAADLAGRLGSDAALGDLDEIALLLAGVHHLKAMQQAFPRPVGPLTTGDLYEARRLYAAARRELPNAAPYLLLGLTGRMSRPHEAMRVYYHLSDARDPALGAPEEAGVIFEALFEDLETAARMLERDAEGELDADDARMRVAHFADYAAGLAGEARAAGDKVVFNRIEACRDVAAGSLARFAEQSLAALRRAMPVRHAGGSSRLMALRPDYARPLAPRVVGAAREGAAFLAGAGELGRRLEREAIAEGVVADAIEEARRYVGDLVPEIRAAEGDDRMAARRLMEHMLDITAPLVPADEIALLRERAHAAALTA